MPEPKKSTPKRFQYLKGAIGRRASIARLGQGRAHFNTSKVRLEVSPSMPDASFASISIPQRCDWKGSLGGTGEPPFLFQYLKGAIGSPPQAAPPRDAENISIPQRCDWKQPPSRGRPDRVVFQYLKGAIGRWSSGTPTSRPASNFNTSKVRLEARSSQLQSAAEQR